MKYNANILDYCLPDYYQGCSPERGEVLAVPVDNQTNAEEFLESLRDEWFGTCGPELSEGWDDDAVLAEMARFVRVRASYGDLFPQAGPRDDDDDEPGSYAYVLISCEDE